MKIMYSDLKKAGACPLGLQLFRKYFGNGGEVTPFRLELWERGPGLLTFAARVLFRPEALDFWDNRTDLPRIERFMRAAVLHDKATGAMG